MTYSLSNIRSVLAAAVGAATLLATEEQASAQVVLAQTGGTKTAIGWVIVLLCIFLGLLVVCRPAARNPIELKKVLRAKGKK
jgi:hypothetical protein